MQPSNWWMVEYSHNNSNGRQWLTLEQWDNLTNAGWIVRRSGYSPQDEFPMYAVKFFQANTEIVAEGLGIEDWTRVTGEDTNAEGCGTCGPPHHFYTTELTENRIKGYIPNKDSDLALEGDDTFYENTKPLVQAMKDILFPEIRTSRISNIE